MALEKRTIKIVSIVGVIIVELEVWPQSDGYNYREPLIKFQTRDNSTWLPWIKKINDFLREYESSNKDCSMPLAQRLSVPTFDERMWMPCNIGNVYGYKNGAPCVFLRLAHNHNWVPEPYNLSLPLPIPTEIEMPHRIKYAMDQCPPHLFDDFMWVSCDGESTSDQENIGPVQYIPEGCRQGFPMALIKRTPAPIIAVLFEVPRRFGEVVDNHGIIDNHIFKL